MEPSRASIPRGQYFAFRLVDPGEFEGYTIHWLFNGRRIPGAHKPELGFFHMRPRFDGEYKVVLTRGPEILGSNKVKLETLAAEAQAVVLQSEEELETDACFFDPLAPEPVTAPAEDPSKKKRAFLQKALSKTKKSAA